jgi:hypothetical protein
LLPLEHLLIYGNWHSQVKNAFFQSVAPKSVENSLMNRIVLALLFTAPMFQGQTPNPLLELGPILSFETPQTGTMPRGWTGGPPETIFVDNTIVHGGQWAARLERSASSSQDFSTITKAIAADISGTTIEWRGFLRTEDVSNFTGLWLREDGESGPVAFDNMQQRQIKGTNDWKEYSVTLPLRSDAKQIYFGVLMAGTGKIWADDLQLLVDGKPVWDAPKAERVKTVLDSDHGFDGGSPVLLSGVSKLQVENLATLGKVWGFLKYHHPTVTGGQRQWDYDLFRVMPKVLVARDHETAHAAIRDWIRALGDVSPCTKCATLRDDDLHLKPELSWIGDETKLGHDLAELLRTIYRNRPTTDQFYVSLAPNIGNPVFQHELAYANIPSPDAGYQLLALFRLWNIIEYWYPNRNVLDGDWDSVLSEFIPRIALAKTRDAYQLELIALIAKITDTHANLWSAPPQSRPPAGTCQLPIVTRFIEDRAVVTGYSDALPGPVTGFKLGDAIESLDGVSVQDLVQQWQPYYPASNRAARMRDIARGITRGSCTTVAAGIRRENQSLTITAQRVPLGGVNQAAGSTHDLPGETFRLLSDDVAYLKLSTVKSAQVDDYINRAKNTKGLVVDIRNYPSEFVVFTLGSHFAEGPTQFVRFTTGDLQNPGAFFWRGQSPTLSSAQPHYGGKVVILVDEVSQSQAEYTAMAFRSTPHAIVVGSTTAGADGNVSEIPLPGGHRTMISGIGVFYPDRKPTQRIGIVPDIEVRPTIAGVRAGRDEVLERALREILGPQTSQTEIERLSHP